jgi:hypothetical protein
MKSRFFKKVSFDQPDDKVVLHNSESLGIVLDISRLIDLERKSFNEEPNTLVVPYVHAHGLYLITLPARTTTELLKDIEDFERRAGVDCFRGFVSVANWNRKVSFGVSPLRPAIVAEGLRLAWPNDGQYFIPGFEPERDFGSE